MRRLLSKTIVVLVLFAQFAVGQTTSDKMLDVRQLMTETEFKSCGLQKLSDVEVKNLNEWLTNTVAKTIEATHAQDMAQMNGGQINFADLDGAIIVADDGQFLGEITSNSVDPKSLINQIGEYGSEISSTSIFNKISEYGSEISALSPFNSLSSTPPRIFKGNKFLGYLTVNKLKTPGVDPYALIGWLKSNE